MIRSGLDSSRHGGCADEGLWNWVLASRQEQDALASRIPAPAELRAPRRRAPGPPVEWVRDVVLGGVPCREYSAASGRGADVLVFAHGGAFVTGSLESHDRLCRELALSTGRLVVAVDYRLAPEAPAPAAVEDVLAVAGALHLRARETGQQLDVALGGDSAGATIVLLAALRLLSDQGGVPLSALWLICPTADLSGRLAMKSPYAEGWGLSARALQHYLALWSAPASGAFRAPDVLQLTKDRVGLPSASFGRDGRCRVLVATAGLDPLQEEGEELALALGVPPTHHPGLVHGFVQLVDASPACAAATRALVAWEGLRASASR